MNTTQGTSIGRRCRWCYVPLKGKATFCEDCNSDNGDELAMVFEEEACKSDSKCLALIDSLNGDTIEDVIPTDLTLEQVAQINHVLRKNGIITKDYRLAIVMKKW